MSEQPIQLSQTGQDPDTYCGLLYSAEYQTHGRTECDDHGDYLTWNAAKDALVEMLSRLSADELRYVCQPVVVESRWDNGQGQGTKAREIDLDTFDWKS